MPNSQVSHTKFLKQILRRKITWHTRKKYRNKLKLWEKKYFLKDRL